MSDTYQEIYDTIVLAGEPLPFTLPAWVALTLLNGISVWKL